MYRMPNPELYFGELDMYTVLLSTPGDGMVNLRFRSDTDMYDKVLEYAETLSVVDNSLIEYENTLNDTEDCGISWYVAPYDVFWYGYSLYDDNEIDVSISYYYENKFYNQYIVSIYINGYQNCEFLDIAPYERVDSIDSPVGNGTEINSQTASETKPVATATPKPERRKGKGRLKRQMQSSPTAVCSIWLIWQVRKPWMLI